MLFSKSVADRMLAMAPFELFVVRLWRSFGNCANFECKNGAVLAKLRHSCSKCLQDCPCRRRKQLAASDSSDTPGRMLFCEGGAFVFVSGR